MNGRDLLPEFSRARDYFLYDGTRRYLDLWQEDGHALLGHRPGRAKSLIKQELDRGLLAAYPTRGTGLLHRALSDLFPERSSFRWYTDGGRFRELVEILLGHTGKDLRIPDPAVNDDSSDGVMIWRPWLEDRSRKARIVLPVLPLPGSGFLTVAAIRDGLPDRIVPSDPVPGYLSTTLARIVYDLTTHLRGFDTSMWSRFDARWWDRRGPYLRLRCAPDEFLGVYRRFLDAGIILAPEYGKPSIVPASFDEGSVRRIASIDAVV